MHSMPADDAATSMAPRAWPTESAMRASAPTDDCSRATASGPCSLISSPTPSKIVSTRSSTRSRAFVRHHPWHSSLRRPSLSWTIPYPHAAVPGSMPRTFTPQGYGPLRTFLLLHDLDVSADERRRLLVDPTLAAVRAGVLRMGECRPGRKPDARPGGVIVG